MYQYANSLSCTCPEDRSNFFLNFEQIGPSFDENGNIEGSQISTVASIMIDAECANVLVSALSHLLEENGEPEDDTADK